MDLELSLNFKKKKEKQLCGIAACGFVPHPPPLPNKPKQNKLASAHVRVLHCYIRLPFFFSARLCGNITVALQMRKQTTPSLIRINFYILKNRGEEEEKKKLELHSRTIFRTAVTFLSRLEHIPPSSFSSIQVRKKRGEGRLILYKLYRKHRQFSSLALLLFCRVAFNVHLFFVLASSVLRRYI